MIENLSWMQGSWSCEIWDGVFQEQWSSASGGTLIGSGRHLKDGATTFMEFLAVEPFEDGLAMFILLGSLTKEPRAPHVFRLTSCSNHEAVFQNPENPFPATIRYRRVDEASLHCQLTGTRDGAPVIEDFNFRRTISPQAF